MTVDHALSGDGGSVYCQNCGKQIGADVSFCPECGTEVVGSTEGSERVRSSNSKYGLIAGIGATVLAVIVAGVFAGTETGERLFGMLFLVGWILFPVSMYYDTRNVRETTGWSPNRVLWVLGTIPPYLNIVVSLVYLYRRRDYATDTSIDDPAGASASVETPAPEGKAGPDVARDEQSEPEPMARTEAEQDTDADDSPPASRSGTERSASDSGPTATARVSRDQIYTEGENRYVETPIGPDKRLHTDGAGNHYYQRGQAVRALYGGLALISVAAAVFFLAFFPGAPGGPGSPRGRFLFSLVNAVPLGNVIVGIVALWIAYQLASTAYEGREYVAVEDSG